MVLGSTCRFLPQTVKSVHSSFHTNNIAGNHFDEISINESVSIKEDLVNREMECRICWACWSSCEQDETYSAIHGYNLLIFAGVRWTASWFTDVYYVNTFLKSKIKHYHFSVAYLFSLLAIHICWVMSTIYPECIALEITVPSGATQIGYPGYWELLAPWPTTSVVHNFWQLEQYWVLPSEVLCTQFVTGALTTVKHVHINTPNQHNIYSVLHSQEHNKKNIRALRPLVYIFFVVFSKLLKKNKGKKIVV